MSADRLRFFVYLLEYVLLPLTLVENVNNFQIAKAQPQGVFYHLLDFCNFILALLIKMLLVNKACVHYG